LPIAIAIVLVLVAAGVIVFVTTSRSGGDSTGTLSRETKSRDSASNTAVVAAEVDEGAGRERAEETREQLGGVPAVPSGEKVTKWEPIDEEELGVTRRQFFNRGLLAAFALGLASFGAGAIAFIWPFSTGGIGGLVKTGRKIDDILAEINDTKTPAYFAEARAYVQPYPTDDVENAIDAGYPDALIPNLEQGFTVLYQKCPHLGCRVPWCHSSQWFECPCHGSKYNRVGEKRDGPAPRGMTHWRGEVGDDGALTIDTSLEYAGLPIGTDTTEQRPEGPSCI
jgi:cytochrome b6-f complex iron-sulfur subunit